MFFSRGQSNGNSRLDLSLSLAYDKSFSINSFHQNTIDKIRLDDKYYSEKAPGISYLAYPIAWVFSQFFSKQEFLSSYFLANIFLYLSTVLISSLISALSSLYFFRIIRYFNKVTPREAAIITFAVYLGTGFFPYSTSLFSHQVCASIIVFIIYFLLRFKESRTKLHAISFMLFNFFLPFFEYPTIVVSLMFFIYFVDLLKWKIKKIVQYTPFSFIPLLCLLMHNYFSYGHPLSIGYGKLAGTPFDIGMNEGFFGITFPDPKVFILLLFSFYKGFFIFNPLFFSTLFHLKKENCLDDADFSFTLFAIIFLPLLINSSYFYWQGGNCFGPRHLIIIIAPLSILLHGFFKVRSFSFCFFLLLSYITNLTATAVDVFTPERVPIPFLWNLKAILTNHISINRNGFLTNFYDGNYAFIYPFGETGATNLGAIFGFSGQISLAFIVIIHIFMALLIYRILNR